MTIQDHLKSQKVTHGYEMRQEKQKAMFLFLVNTILFHEHFLFLSNIFCSIFTHVSTTPRTTTTTTTKLLLGPLSGARGQKSRLLKLMRNQGFTLRVLAKII